jgi:hypothetical protein
MDSLDALQMTARELETTPAEAIRPLLTHYIGCWRERDEQLQAVVIAARSFMAEADKQDENPIMRNLLRVMEDMLSSTETETTLPILANRAGELLEARHGCHRARLG